MPMDFPNMDSLKRHAEVWKFRQPPENESEAGYRKALSEFVKPHDLIESQEIAFGKGWDKWDDTEKMIALIEGMNKR